MSNASWTLRGVQRLVVVASTPRTGSNLLCTAIGATGVVNTPREWLNPQGWSVPRSPKSGVRGPRLLVHRRVVRRLGRTLGVRSLASLPRYSGRRLHAYLTACANDERSPDGTFGLKIMWLHYEEMVLPNARGFHAVNVPVVWVRTTRRDRVQQAVSLARAKATRQWTSQHVPKGAAAYDAGAIDQCLATIDVGERNWDRYFAEHGISPLEVVYEDLDAGYEQVMAGVLAHCGIDAPVPPRQLERQRDSESADWVVRYRSERCLD